MNDNEIEFVYSKGKRKSEIQKLYDELKKNALKLWEYAIHLDTLGGERNSCSKTNHDVTFMDMKYSRYYKEKEKKTKRSSLFVKSNTCF